MSKEDFAAYFAALEKSSDRARSIIYIFTLVSVATLYYTINSFAYPSRQFILDDFKKRAECRFEAPNPSDSCTNLLGKRFYDHLSPQQRESTLDKDSWQHQLNSFYDDSLALRTFQFPIFGITTDRDLAWVVFPFLGILEYYLIWLALARAKSMFRFLADQNKSDPMRLRLILSTQLLTSPLNDQSSELSKIHQTVWKSLAILVFCIPSLASLATILDQTNVLAIIRHSDPFALAYVRFKFTLPFISRFVIELVLLTVQCILLVKLICVGRAFGRDQGFAQCSIAHAESSPAY